MRILTLFLRHGTSKYSGALGALHQLAARTLPGAERDTVVIDNTLTEASVLGADGTQIIPGDNRHWEFSGWDAGIRHVGARIWTYDYVHFVTSAFEELHSGYLDRFSTPLLERTLRRPAAVGHIDCYNTPVRAFGYTSRHWMRTSYFLVRPTEVKALGSLVSVSNGAGLFSGDPESPFREDAPLDAEFRANIIGWLTGEGTGQGVQWHSRFPLSRETLPYFENKTRAILNEYLLSARLRALGCDIIDVTWLACTPGPREPWPGWCEQISARAVPA